MDEPPGLSKVIDALFAGALLLAFVAFWLLVASQVGRCFWR